MIDSVLRRSIDRRLLRSSRSLGRRAVLGLLFATGVLAAPVSAARPVDVDGPRADEGVSYAGRVIEGETGQPVEDAEIVVERSIRGAAPQAWPAWAGASTLRTDAVGRFRLDFPPEQVAERRLVIAMRIRHPAFIPRKSRKVALADILNGQAHGDEPFFARIALERGVEYTAQVVVPGGRPAPGIPYAFENGTARAVLSSPMLIDDEEGATDDEGRIRLRMPRTHALALYVGPPRTARARFPYAPYQHFWGTDNPSGQPDVWAPTDLGRIVLARGIRLPGRLLDTEGRPIACQTITAYPALGRDRHTTTTEADGSFTLGPLRPANYQVHGEGQGPIYGSGDRDAPPLRQPIRVVRPVHVFLKEDNPPEPLALREVPTVRVEVRFVDAKGQPARGSATIITGVFLDERGVGRGVPLNQRAGPTSRINAPEPQGAAAVIPWAMQDQPDSDGRIVFLAPPGLGTATVYAQPLDELTAYKHRPDPNGPILPGPPVRLGALEADRLVTMIAYRAPTVLVSVKTEDGVVPADLMVNARHRIGVQNYGNLFVRQADGRYRSQSLMPDLEYEIAVSARGSVYAPGPIRRVSLPEGGTTELSFLLSRRPKPASVGEPAPPFTIKTMDGRTWSLATLRGKTVLLHFWQTGPRPVVPGQLDQRIPNVAGLKVVDERFGNDPRFAMIGLCLSDDPQAAAEVIRSAGLSWSQAILRDRSSEPVFVAYAYGLPLSDVIFLIGPDGKLIARGLWGEALEKAVAESLAGR